MSFVTDDSMRRMKCHTWMLRGGYDIYILKVCYHHRYKLKNPTQMSVQDYTVHKVFSSTFCTVLILEAKRVKIFTCDAVAKAVCYYGSIPV